MIATVENQTWRSQLLKWRVPAALFLVVGLAALRSERRVGPFHLTHWTFTYEHGFIKRGLVGEIVGRIVGPPSTALLAGLSFAFTVVVAALLFRLFLEPARREARFGTWLFALIAGTHSGTISNLVLDAGRFDQIGLLILLGCLAVIRRGTPTMRWVLVPAACVVGLLVHEAFLFLSLPLILATWHYEDAGPRQRAPCAGMRAPIAALACSGFSRSERGYCPGPPASPPIDACTTPRPWCDHAHHRQRPAKPNSRESTPLTTSSR
jgi:hypothetical protein